MSKASGGDEIAAELFQVLKESAVKVMYSICSKLGKLSSGHRKRSVSIPSPERGNAKECSN